jgi:hypothetical protein
LIAWLLEGIKAPARANTDMVRAMTLLGFREEFKFTLILLRKWVVSLWIRYRIKWAQYCIYYHVFFT